MNAVGATPFHQRPAVRGLAAAAVIAAGVLLVWSAISTSSAKVVASTSGTSFFTAGTVALTQPDTVVELLFDADGLYPEISISGCVEIEYSGSVPAAVRLHGQPLGGSGLESFVDFEVRERSASCGEDIPAQGPLIYSGLLSQLWADHPDYANAIVLRPEMVNGDRIVIEATASVRDDNEAQGLTTEFSLTIEARP